MNAPDPSLLIDARALTRRFGERLAVDVLNLRLRAGELVALLGPNGAGKTTTMRMLCGLLAPSSGEAQICGHRLGSSESGNAAIRVRCGIAPEAAGFYERLSARDNLRFFGGLQGMSRAQIESRAQFELDRFGLGARADDLTGTFSKGMKQRLSLARALLHQPQLLFLDEPTAGLDPRAAADVHALILDLKAAGVGVVLSTHSLEEAEMLSEEVLVLDTRTLYRGPAQDLGGDSGKTVTVQTLSVPSETFMAPPGTALLGQQDRTWVFRIERDDQIADILRELMRIDARVIDVSQSRRSDLRERYLALWNHP